MYKIIDIEENFPITGEASVSLLSIGDNILKTASSDSVEYLKSLKDLDNNYVYALVLAMGATEWYGPNKRADGWPERPVPGAVEKGQTLFDKYKTFETHAKVYEHHINKDPNKAIGKVVKAFYNLKMHRVELIVALDKVKAKEHIARLRDGIFIPWSMGAKVPFDQCSICGNRASSTSQYCVHMRNMPNKILEDGRRVFVWNIDPVFIDISAVISPADKTAYTIMVKAASEYSYESAPSAVIGNKIASLTRKVAYLGKISDIYKKINGITMDVDKDTKNTADMVRKLVLPDYENNRLSDEEINDLTNRYSIKEILRGSLRNNVLLDHLDFVRTLISSLGLPAEIAKPLAEKLKIIEPIVLDKVKDRPDIFDAGRELFGLTDNQYDSMEIDKDLQKKAYIKEYLKRTLIPRPIQSEFDPAFATIETVDPNTGKKYKAFSGSATSARLGIGEDQLKTILGAALLGGAAYKMMGGPRALKILLLPPAAYGLYRLTKSVVTDPKDAYKIPGYDVIVPEYTEFVEEKKASDMDSVVGLTIMVGSEPNLPLFEKIKLANEVGRIDISNELNVEDVFYKLGNFVYNCL